MLVSNLIPVIGPYYLFGDNFYITTADIGTGFGSA